MNLRELIALAFSRLAASRLRAALTMLGVIIGVGAVVALVGVGQGATAGITAQLQDLGTNLLTITPGRTFSAGTFGSNGSATTLTLADSNAVAALDGVAAVAPEINSSQVVISGGNNTTTSIVGTTPSYLSIRKYDIWQGAFLSPAAEANSLRVAVIGATTATNLGMTASAVGSNIEIGGIPFQVVGILQPKGGSGALSQDDQILIPLTTMAAQFSNVNRVQAIFVSVSSSDLISGVQSTITATLDARHNIASGAQADFNIANQAQLLGTVTSVSGLLTILLAGIASISLIVGGIGIMNIMLVSVRERTREIGIRKAIGAKRSDIMAQFLVEALTLSIVGGAIGIGVGLLASWGIGRFAGWAFTFSAPTILLALGFSLAVGVIFGVWPARQAARLDPVAALRYE